MQRLARISGVLYLALAMLGVCSPLLLEHLVVPGDAAATAAELRGSRALFATSLVGWAAIVVIDAALAVTLYVLLKADRTLALLTATTRGLYAAMLAALLPQLYEAHRLLGRDADDRAFANIESFQTGFLVAILFFGVHVVLLGFLLFRSGMVPRALGASVGLSGGAYVSDSFGSLLVAGYGGAVATALIAVILVGELGLVGWLLVKGVRPRERALSGR